jgi:hypothetical protein
MIDFLYRVVRPLLFRLDPEEAHELTFSTLPMARWLAELSQLRPDPRLACKVGPLTFAGPVGLAAGLDKNGVGIRTWEALGFGAIEVGTVTGLAQTGNRLTRWPKTFAAELRALDAGLVKLPGVLRQLAAPLVPGETAKSPAVATRRTRCRQALRLLKG